ncbi:3-keto-disaccharide hydrolase [Labilibacter marinus]|uniref:3-keto-disaccharide hydrolase n=1 Tax=Labilibacter marinus TaxID=1477105 RepID=UPI00082C4683|nr:DUF1080 domain-containing protein [Labilibacter marinus]
MKKTIIISLIFFLCLNTFGQEKKQNNFADWEIKPALVVAAKNSKAPSDAIILFSGHLSQWEHIDGSKIEWPASKKRFKILPETKSIHTKKSFGDCQLHVEWRVPKNEDHGKKMNYGNSGIYFMEQYEVQVYDSYNNHRKIYSNGQAGSIYKQYSPLVNVCKKPGKWESYDIVFTAPQFKDDGTLKSPAYFTVFHNGVLIQNHVELTGPTTHLKYTEYKKHPEKMPLLIQSHGSAVEYRNIWIRDL